MSIKWKTRTQVCQQGSKIRHKWAILVTRRLKKQGQLVTLIHTAGRNASIITNCTFSTTGGDNSVQFGQNYHDFCTQEKWLYSETTDGNVFRSNLALMSWQWHSRCICSVTRTSCRYLKMCVARCCLNATGLRKVRWGQLYHCFTCWMWPVWGN